jgi:D-Tyr-tRNAtyr deacylase
MGWETRGNNLYYYRKKRIVGRVVSEYVGRGLMAQEIELMDLTERKERYDRIRAMRQQKEEFGFFDNQVSQMNLLVDHMVGGFLIISGFHKYKGQWRRRRNVNYKR